MKIGLIDVDGHNFPNLALMKISSYHKKLGDHVEWYDNISGIDEEYDLVYMSKVFTSLYSPDYIYPIYSKKIIKGGYGYDNYNEPFSGYEKTFPDYSIYYNIYPKFKYTAFGYLTRGCPRNCDFCMVGKYEGTKNRKVCDISDFYDPQMHKEIKLLDPNLFANKDSISLLKSLVDAKTIIDITQGFDIRILTQEQAKIINNMRLKRLHFAWDNIDNITENMLREKRDWFKFDFRKMIVYVLVNFNTTFEEDLYRVNTLRELNYTPYVMIYEKPTAPQNVKRLQRWTNNMSHFYHKHLSTFDEYIYNEVKHRRRFESFKGEINLYIEDQKIKDTLF